MRILMLEPAARDDAAGLDQRLDHRLVGVALLALVGDDALAGEARRLRGEGAVLVDGVGDRRVDAARFQRARIRGPDVEVLAAVARRGVHEAGAGVVGDVVAVEQRHVEVVAAMRAAADARSDSPPASSAGTSPTFSKAVDSRLLEHVGGEIVGQDEDVAGLRPIVRPAPR